MLSPVEANRCNFAAYRRTMGTGNTGWRARKPFPAGKNLGWFLQILSAPRLGLGLFIPISAKQRIATSRQPQAWSQLGAQLEQLAEDEMVDEEYIEEMEKRLEQLRAQEEQDWFSHASLEATDSLKESQNSDMAKLERDMNEAGDALEALAENADKMNAAQKQKLTEEFEHALQGLQNGALKPSKELLDQLSKLDPNNLAKLSPEHMEPLKENMEKLNESLENAGQGQGDDWSDQLLGDIEGDGDGQHTVDESASKASAGGAGAQ